MAESCLSKSPTLEIDHDTGNITPDNERTSQDSNSIELLEKEKKPNTFQPAEGPEIVIYDPSFERPSMITDDGKKEKLLPGKIMSQTRIQENDNFVNDNVSSNSDGNVSNNVNYSHVPYVESTILPEANVVVVGVIPESVIMDGPAAQGDSDSSGEIPEQVKCKSELSVMISVVILTILFIGSGLGVLTYILRNNNTEHATLIPNATSPDGDTKGGSNSGPSLSNTLTPTPVATVRPLTDHPTYRPSRNPTPWPTSAPTPQPTPSIWDRCSSTNRCSRW